MRNVRFEAAACHINTNVLQASEAGGADDGMGLGKMFADPNLFGKLAANPRTAKHLADPSFMQKVSRASSPIPTGD